MNKLLVSDIINLKSDNYHIKIKSKDVVINIDGHTKLYLVNENVHKIDLNLRENSNLEVYLYNSKLSNDLIININQNKLTKVNLNISIISNANCELTVNNNIEGNNNSSLINSRIISNKELMKMIINVKIEKNTLNNIALEDLKGVNNGGFVHIEPNIICLSNEVSANHLTTIGSLNKDMLNYLMSKELEEEVAKELLLQGFKYSNMDEYIKNLEGE